jgi:hypothetical protein
MQRTYYSYKEKEENTLEAADWLADIDIDPIYYSNQDE